METEGHFNFEEDELGSFQFGLVQGQMDYRIENTGEIERLEFSWKGQDENAYWSGQTGISGSISAPQKKIVSAYKTTGGQLAGAYAYAAGCRTHVRKCAACSSHQSCPVKRHVPQIQT